MASNAPTVSLDWNGRCRIQIEIRAMARMGTQLKRTYRDEVSSQSAFWNLQALELRVDLIVLGNRHTPWKRAKVY